MAEDVAGQVFLNWFFKSFIRFFKSQVERVGLHWNTILSCEYVAHLLVSWFVSPVVCDTADCKVEEEEIKVERRGSGFVIFDSFQFFYHNRGLESLQLLFKQRD